MNDLRYSIDAAGAKSMFYNKKFIVYVEGDDDLIFWTNIFNTAQVEAYIEVVFGIEEIRKKEQEILVDSASFIIAIDSDHSDFIDTRIDHSQIIRTYGYSIENSMFDVKNIEDTIQKIGRTTRVLSTEILLHKDEFSNSFRDLIIYDVANQLYRKGVRVFGDNCHRFLTNNRSIQVCSKSVSDYIELIKDKFSDEEIRNVSKLVENSEKYLWYHIKGHFLSLWVINLVNYFVYKTNGSRITIPLDHLFALTVDCGKNWHEREDIIPVVEKIRRLKKIE